VNDVGFFILRKKVEIGLDGKQCSKCGQEKSTSEFRKAPQRQCLRAECNSCLAKRCKQWRKKNPIYGKTWKKNNHKLDAIYQWRGALKSKYGLSEKDYHELLDKQNRKCAICEKSFTKTPNVDHCHKTGMIRGLTCRACNRGLGMFQDDIIILLKAVTYMGAYEVKIRTNS